MTALLLSFWPYVAAAGGGLVALLAAYLKGRSDKGNAEALKRAGEKAAAAEERLEMHREATDAERRAAGMTDKDALDEALKWRR